MNNVLKEVIAELKEVQALSQVRLENVDPSVRPGVEGKIRNAERSIGALKARYRSEICKYLHVVAATGKYSADFAEKAKSKIMCVDNMYAVKLLTSRIGAKTRFNSFGGQELIMLRGELNRFQQEFGLTVGPIQDHGIASLVAHMPLDEAIDTVLRKNYGLQVHSAVIRRHVADLALEAMHAGSNLVVALYNYTGVAEPFLPAPSATFDFSSEVTDEQVTSTLEEIAKSRRSQNLKKAKKNLPVQVAPVQTDEMQVASEGANNE